MHLRTAALLTRALLTTPGIKVESTIKAGGLVPDDLILRLIRNELATRGWLVRSGPPHIMTLSSAGTTLRDSSSAGDSASAASEAGVAAFLSTSPQPISTATATTAASSTAPAAATNLSDDPSASFLLDGFPRTAIQAAQLDDLVPINLVVSLKTPFSVILARIGGRWVHEPSGRVYNESFNAPQVAGRDDVTGEPLVRRADDSEAVYRARFDKFEQTSAPLLDHYAQQGVLWEVEGLSSDEITPKLFAEFERRFCGGEGP